MTSDEANEVRLKRVLQTAVRNARNAEDAAEAQAVLDAMFPAPAAPESPMALADAVQAEVAVANEAAYDRADDQDPDAPKKRKKAKE